MKSVHSSKLSGTHRLKTITARLRSSTGQLLLGLLVLLLAVPIALVMYRIHAVWPENPEKAVQIIGALFVIFGIVPTAVYLIAYRGEAKLANLCLIVIGTVSTLLAACYLFWASFYIMFPADYLIWSESDFVNDILKFHVGYPIFTPEVNNESFTYVPGSQLVTYFFAWLAGQPFSITAYRTIQLGYALLTAVVAVFCCRRLVNMSFPFERRPQISSFWGPVWLTSLFLLATNSITNPFSTLLHNDSLAQLVTVTAYWLLLEYAATKDKRILLLMAFLPGLGFWVKQSLIIWAGLYFVYLLIFDRPRSLARVTVFGLASFAGIAISFSVGYVLWREDFTYWVFTVLGKHGVSPLRSFRHLLVIWPYLVIGLLGGTFLLKREGLGSLFGLWIIWLALILIETYTSGVAWMLNHIGPGCLIAGIWFFSALACVWRDIVDGTVQTFSTSQA